MHIAVACCGLLVAGAACAADAPPALAAAACPPATAAVVERFISADCGDCWGDANAGAARPSARPFAWVFDWVLPSAQGDAAPLSAAALADGAARGLRAGVSAGAPQQQREQAAGRRGGVAMRVLSGPAWNGYFGLQLRLRGAAAPGTTAWVALVELLPANAEGNPQPRALLRNVSGPLPLAALRRDSWLTDRRAMRWPEGAKPERLVARAWLEDPAGRILAVAQERCAAPPPKRPPA